MEVKDMIFRHFGSPAFNKELFIPVSGIREGCAIDFKPSYGGLWGSPVGEEFCTWEESSLNTSKDTSESGFFDFKLSDDAKVCHISSLLDVKKEFSKYRITENNCKDYYDITFDPLCFKTYIDILKVLKDFDAIVFTPNEDDKLFLYGRGEHEILKDEFLDGCFGLFRYWLCDTVLVGSSEIVIPV